MICQLLILHNFAHMGHLVEMLLPLLDSSGAAFDASKFDAVKSELIKKFGGVTAFVRASATGLWQSLHGEVQKDEIAVFEVMTDKIDDEWWAEYRKKLERRFEQDEIVVRATEIRRL